MLRRTERGAGVPLILAFSRQGRRDYSSVRMGGCIDLSLDCVDDAWRNALERALTGDGVSTPQE